ncbi:MAG: hypothetical protein M1837_001774, partial [Sclerophora amabilis]
MDHDSSESEALTAENEDEADEFRQIEWNFLFDRCESAFGYPPRPEQVDAIYTLTHHQRDVILTAPTGWGKSLVFQSIPLVRRLRTNGMCLVIMPLNVLQQDQLRSMERLLSASCCVLNGDTNSRSLRNQIAKGDFTHVLTSPEIALQETFRTD